MAEKHIVVQGATCKCQFGKTPDKLKVLSHQKEYANDKHANKKLIATTKDIGTATFEKNTFGSCAKMNNGPCKPNITVWEGFYKDEQLSNGGYVLLEDSKASCAIGGMPCVEITDHGQVSEPNQQNFSNAKPAVHAQLNPMADIGKITSDRAQHQGIADSLK